MTATRQRWIESMLLLARPVLRAAAAGQLRATMPVALHPAAAANPDCSQRRTAALEAVARVLVGIAPWLESSGGDDAEATLRIEYRELARAALIHGCTPGHADWLGFERDQQPLVDAAFLAQALLRSPTALWDPLPESTKQQLIASFAGLRNRGPYVNNWLLFAAMTETFLASRGLTYDPMRIAMALELHDQWYLGDGVYGDGPKFHADGYNSFVIQPMLHDIVRTLVNCPPTEERGPLPRICARMLPLVCARLTRWAAIQERQIASDGSWPVVGRSIVYRTAAFQGLAQAAWQQLLPAALPPAQVRCALTAAIRRSLHAPDSVDGDGWLRIGLYGAQPHLGEIYITTGSLYLASTVFLPLGLPVSDPFWSAPDQPWTHVRAWDLGENIAADTSLSLP